MATVPIAGMRERFEELLDPARVIDHPLERRLYSRDGSIAMGEVPSPRLWSWGACPPGPGPTAARGAGFTGMLAIHPDQVPVINRAFSPSAEEIAYAERVVAAFAAAPGTGTVGLDGAMLDLPHLRRAEAVLARPRASSGADLSR